MGKLALSRKAGQSVTVSHEDGGTYRVSVLQITGTSAKIRLTRLDGPQQAADVHYEQFVQLPGGRMRVRNHRRYSDQVSLVFELTAEYRILRSELKP